MNKVTVITNIPAPYSIDLFSAIEDLASDIELSVVFSAMHRKNRQWTIDTSKLKNVYSLESKIIARQDGNYIRYIHIPKGTWKTLNKMDSDILLVYEYSIASLISLLWAKIKKRKYVHITEGTLLSEINIGILQKILRYIILKNSDYFVACSSKSKEKLLKWKVPEEKIQTILLTTDITKYKETRGARELTDKYTLLYVGSLEPRKGIDLLIQALKYLNISDNILLKLVGNGSEEYIRQMKALIAKEQLQVEVAFMGYLEGDKLLEEYRNADVFVFPSRSDCYGLVLVEAYSAGLPIVSSMYADGVYDIVENRVNGIIVDPYDAKMFGASINEVLHDHHYKDSASCMNTKKFEIETEAQAFLNIIKMIQKGV